MTSSSHPPPGISGQMTFGRQADLVIDDANQLMHRHVGEFRLIDGRWWIGNFARTTPLLVFEDDGGRIRIPPGESAALDARVGTVAFAAGAMHYELTYEMVTDQTRLGQAIAHPVTDRLLDDQQIDVLLEFARPWLAGSDELLPSVAQVAQLTKTRRRMVRRHLAEAHRRASVTGVGATSESTEALIIALVATGELTLSQLIARDQA